MEAVEAVGDVTDMDALVVASEEVVNTEPTEEQKKAGNYRKGHLRLDGLDITIEQPRGSVRSGVDDDGNAWSTTMQHTYGYIRGTKGKDGDHIDLFLSDNLEGWSGDVYIVDQVDSHGSFDEHKVMYGFNSLEEAKSAYLSNYSDDWQGLGNITAVSRDEFKKWIKSSKRKIKPFSEYKRVVTGEVSIEAGSVEAGQGDVVGGNVDTDQGLSSSDFQPIGKGEFGNIYDQFRGNPQGAATWLQDNQGGEAVGVFSHTELGDISLVWGDERGGLSHIIKRHIEEQNDFASVDDAVVAIDDVVTNGVFSRENADKVVIDYNGYRVVINKQTRGEDGSVISVGNWIVTAFDRSRNKKEKASSGKTLTTPPSNPRADGVTLPSNDTSSSSESKSSENGGYGRYTREDIKAKADALARQIDAIERGEYFPEEAEDLRAAWDIYQEAKRLKEAGDITSREFSDIEWDWERMANRYLRHMRDTLHNLSLPLFDAYDFWRAQHGAELAESPQKGAGVDGTVWGFVGKDPRRPILHGVHHQGGYAVGADGLILLGDKTAYDKSHDGKTVAPKTGAYIEGKYPDWKAIIPDETGTTATIAPSKLSGLLLYLYTRA